MIEAWGQKLVSKLRVGKRLLNMSTKLRISYYFRGINTLNQKDKIKIFTLKMTIAIPNLDLFL